MRPIQVPKDEMPEGTSQKCEESAIISAMEKAKASIKAGVVFWVELLGRRSCISLTRSQVWCWKKMDNASLGACPSLLSSPCSPGQGPNHFRKFSGAKTCGGALATLVNPGVALHTEERHHAECWSVLFGFLKESCCKYTIPGEWFSREKELRSDFCLLHN